MNSSIKNAPAELDLMTKNQTEGLMGKTARKKSLLGMMKSGTTEFGATAKLSKF